MTNPTSAQPLSEAAYEALAGPELQRLLDAVDEIGEDVDAELASDILSLEFADGTKYVINSHRAARQIWMAAGTNAWHFDPTGDRWVASKTDEELWSVLERVLSDKLGRTVELAR
jgi:CyaY protein